MILKPFYDMQRKLDADIIEKKSLQGAELTDKKYIAWKVEVCEMLNEVRSFKFWSNKPPSRRETILEEWVDGWHFLMSIANDRNYNYVDEVNTGLLEDLSFDDLSTELIDNHLNCAAKYQRAVACSLAFAKKLGFSEKDIMEAYLMKNQVNFERQKQDY